MPTQQEKKITRRNSESDLPHKVRYSFNRSNSESLLSHLMNKFSASSLSAPLRFFSKPAIAPESRSTEPEFEPYDSLSEEEIALEFEEITEETLEDEFLEVSTTQTNIHEEEFVEVPATEKLVEDQFEKMTLVIPPFPDNFPKEVRLLNQFKKQKAADTQGSHDGYTATYDNSHFYVKLFTPDPNIKDSNKMPALEAAAWGSYHMVDSSVLPQRTFPLYDYNEEQQAFVLVGIASELIPGFKTNLEDPLTFEDLQLNVLDHDYGLKREEMIDALEALKEIETREENSLSGWVKNTTNWFTSSASQFIAAKPKPSASFMHEQIIKLLNTQDKKIEQFDNAELLQLSACMHQRKQYIPELITSCTCETQSAAYQAETEQLERSINAITAFTSLTMKTCTDISKLEAFDRYHREKNLQGLLNDNTLKHKDLEMSVADLRKYRIIKNEAKITVRSYNRFENDCHNKNLGKWGRIDFDMSWWKFLRKFKDISQAEQLLSEPVGQFKHETNDIDHFPNVKAPLRYFPSNGSVLSTIHENCYSDDHAAPFQKLEEHPVYDFHVMLSFLQDALVTPEMFKANAKLFLLTDVTFNDRYDNNKEKNLYDEFTQHEISEFKAMKKALLKSSKLKTFMKKYGDNALPLIKENFTAMKDFYQTKVDNNETHFQEMVDAIDLNNIEANFKAIQTATREQDHNKDRPYVPTQRRRP